MTQTRMIDEFDDLRDALAIPFHPSRTQKKRKLHLTFNDLANPQTHPKSIGTLQHPGFFSMPFNQTGQKFHEDVYIKTPDTDIYLPKTLGQFKELIERAVEHHYLSGYAHNKDSCQIHISQGLLSPEETLRAVGQHIDALYSHAAQGRYINNNQYICSDALPTQFYDQAFIIDNDVVSRMRAQDTYNYVDRTLAAQIDSNHAVSFRPYEIVNYESFTVHSAQAAIEETFRTMCLIRFIPYDEKVWQKVEPEDVLENNPALLKAFKKPMP